ncbi:MAG TPA: hypothetical protein VNN79_11645 [Actinomycetota bacterium]|nr:hypothetical protein [Actinomycetota bacterium]
MEPNEIWELIVKADERLKYAREDQADLRRGQAEGFLREALGGAREIGNAQLEQQALTRLGDLGITDA